MIKVFFIYKTNLLYSISLSVLEVKSARSAAFFCLRPVSHWENSWQLTLFITVLLHAQHGLQDEVWLDLCWNKPPPPYKWRHTALHAFLLQKRGKHCLRKGIDAAEALLARFTVFKLKSCIFTKTVSPDDKLKKLLWSICVLLMLAAYWLILKGCVLFFFPTFPLLEF